MNKFSVSLLLAALSCFGFNSFAADEAVNTTEVTTAVEGENTATQATDAATQEVVDPKATPAKK
jgi:hypothetical protein